ncbi:DUF3999 family protein [Sporohalobacter salinus]|uniref:DUF3999 family protein n=1 Tax=Sporohalobacter salinus TaxID=1494606 RepID=UPI0019607BB0|nr:DUF3999 family protein [Sporohalobacter salinus]MBM7624255.1 hypothetical protein [Sporohalobacter salinus]
MYKTRFKGGILLIIVLLGVMGGIVKAEKFDNWSYYKKINWQGEQKYQAFFLDQDIYRYAREDFADIRIVNQQDQFVPYYIKQGYGVTKKKEISYNAQQIFSFQKKEDSYFDFKVNPLAKNKDIVGDKIVLTIPTQNYLKKIVLFGSYGGEKWEKITKDKIYKVDGLAKEVINLKQVQKYHYYRIKVKDNVEQIKIKDLKLLYTIQNKEKLNFTAQEKIDYKIVPKDEYTIIKLDNINRLKIKEIKLCTAENYKRRYLVYRKQDNIKHSIKQGKVYNLQFKEFEINDQTIDFGRSPVSDSKLYIKIIDNDDRPLALEDIIVKYYRHKLIFESAGKAPYQIYFGFKHADKPNYDLQSYQQYIGQSEQGRATLGKIHKQTKKVTKLSKKDSEIKLKYIFNGVIILVSLLLIIVLLKKLNLSEKQN